MRPTDTSDGSHRRPLILVASAVFLVVTLILVYVLVQVDRKDPSSQRESVNSNGLKHRLGAFAIPPDDLIRARRTGLDLAITRQIPAGDRRAAALRENGFQILDNSILNIVYSAYCPGGRATCQPPKSSERERMLEEVRAVGKKGRTAEGVAGYYLIDDAWTNFSGALPAVYAALRQVDPTKPTLCGLVLPISYRSPDGQMVSGIGAFRRALVNYSPKWCDSILIYSYVPFTQNPKPRNADWEMSATLTPALELLRKRGWKESVQPLIGTPQAFGYNPRIGERGSAFYEQLPTARQLREQVRGFCRHGAQSIVAYAWKDPGKGKVTSLHNSAPLRSGLSAGVRDCRAEYW